MERLKRCSRKKPEADTLDEDGTYYCSVCLAPADPEDGVFSSVFGSRGRRLVKMSTEKGFQFGRFMGLVFRG